AVDGIDLSVKSAECVVLLGPSGCGKTTTLRLVAGFLRPDGGEILLDGNKIADENSMDPPEKRHLGMVFQSYAVWPHRTVFQNVAYGLTINKRPKREIGDRVKQVLEMVQLKGLDRRYPGELSGGQQQRVALARAIITEPSMLLLDEPLSNLDAALREEMRFELKELQQRIRVTTLYVTHDQEEALVLADRIVVMTQGKIQQVDTPEHIYLHSANRFVATFVGLTNIIEGTVDAIDGANGRVRVASPLGEPFWASGPNNHLKVLRTGSKVFVSVRPEAIAVNDGQTSENPLFRGKIQKRAFLGNRIDLRVDVQGKNLRCQVPKLKEGFGEGVTVRFNSELAWVIQ
ncbi:MAG: ABC transporter ATP-binding protein, partial [Candidatus Methylomirabilales bacterium]